MTVEDIGPHRHAYVQALLEHYTIRLALADELNQKLMRAHGTPADPYFGLIRPNEPSQRSACQLM